MSDSGASVSVWLEQLKDGNEEAAARLWDPSRDPAGDGRRRPGTERPGVAT
jgi:hypothetical protein